MDIDPRAKAGAANNADLYEAIFTAHGLRYRREPFGFVAEDLPPPYYSCLTISDPEAIDAQEAAIEAGRQRFEGGFGFKDSFCRHEMSGSSMRILLTASWIHALASNFQTDRMPQGWQRVCAAEDLETWEQAWKAGGSPSCDRIFPAALLQDRRIFILGHRTEDGWAAGCIANLSPDSVGISNIFARSHDYPAHRAAVEAVASLALGLPLVGYEHGADLASMLSLGFQKVGDLRIWVHHEPDEGDEPDEAHAS